MAVLEKKFKYYSLSHGCAEAVEIDRKSAIIRLEGQGCLNGSFAVDNSTKSNPVKTKYASVWREEVSE